MVDADDVPVFTGTLRECEDWLDYHENLERTSVLRRVLNWFRRRRSTADEPHGPHDDPGVSGPLP